VIERRDRGRTARAPGRLERADQVAEGHAAIPQKDLAGGRVVHAHLAQGRAGLEPWRPALDDDGAHRPVFRGLRARRDARIDREDVRVRSVADEGLLAVQHEGVAFEHRRRAHAAEGIAPGAGLRQRPGTDLLEAEHG
jgi:hypothetical protein